MGGTEGQTVSCPIKLAGADAESRAAALEMNLAIDPTLVSFSGFRCPQADDSDSCDGAVSGALPTGHDYNFSMEREDHGVVKIQLVAVQFPASLLSQAYFNGPFLEGGDGQFLTLDFMLNSDVSGTLVNLSGAVASNPDSVSLVYSWLDGILTTEIAAGDG